MENNQDELRKRVLRRITPQKVFAKEVKLSKERVNVWLRNKNGKSNLSKRNVAIVEAWLDE